MNKLKTGDEVIIISGKDKGKTGTLTKFLAKDKCIAVSYTHLTLPTNREV